VVSEAATAHEEVASASAREKGWRRSELSSSSAEKEPNSGIVTETPSGITAETPSGIAGETPSGIVLTAIPEGVSEGVPVEIPVGVAEAIPKGVCVAALEAVSEPLPLSAAIQEGVSFLRHRRIRLKRSSARGASDESTGDEMDGGCSDELARETGGGAPNAKGSMSPPMGVWSVVLWRRIARSRTRPLQSRCGRRG